MRERVYIFLQKAGGALLSGLLLAPLMYLALLSIASNWDFPRLFPASYSIETWMRMFDGSSGLGRSFALSVAVSLTVAVTATVAGYVTGKYIAYHRWKKRLLFLAYIPFVMSPVILGTCLMYLYIKAGLTGSAAGVVLSQIMFAYGFAIVFFSAFWNTRTRALEDLVYTLGGSPFQAYRRVLIPISRNALLICFFQTFLISWFQYGLTVLIGSGKVQTLPVKVYEYIGEANVFVAALAGLLLILPPAVLLAVNKRYVFKPLGHGA